MGHSSFQRKSRNLATVPLFSWKLFIFFKNSIRIISNWRPTTDGSYRKAVVLSIFFQFFLGPLSHLYRSSSYRFPRPSVSETTRPAFFLLLLFSFPFWRVEIFYGPDSHRSIIKWGIHASSKKCHCRPLMDLYIFLSCCFAAAGCRWWLWLLSVIIVIIILRPASCQNATVYLGRANVSLWTWSR